MKQRRNLLQALETVEMIRPQALQSTPETPAGGSVRCMIAALHLTPRLYPTEML